MNSWDHVRYSWHLIYPLIPIFIAIGFGWNWVSIADDALITHRYVENFAIDGQPYFNTGDRVLGLSSPGYLLLLRGMTYAIPLGVAYKLIAAIGYLLSGVALSLLVPRRHHKYRLLATVIFSANLHLLYWYFSGLETFLIPTFALVALLAIARRSSSLLILAVGLSVLFRPEAWFALVPIVVVAIYSTRNEAVLELWRSPRNSVLASIALVVTGYVMVATFIIANYDNFIPMSVQAKAILQFPWNSDRIETFMSQAIATLNIPVPFGYLIGVLIIPVAVVYAVRKRSGSDYAAFVWPVVVSAIIFAGYLLISGAATWGWHFAFISFAVTFLLLASATILARRAKKLAIPVIVAVVLLSIWSGADYGNGRNNRIADFYVDQMQTAGNFVRDNYEDNTVVVTGSLGYFGAATMGLEVHDSVGLVTPEYVEARMIDKDASILNVIPWDVFVCHLEPVPRDPVAACLPDEQEGRLVDNFGVIWVIENTRPANLDR